MRVKSFSLLFFILMSSIIFSACTKEDAQEFSSQELLKIAGKWKIVEFAGNTREEHIEPISEGYTVSQEQIENQNEKYLNSELSIEPNKIKSFNPASELGYYYDFNELFDYFRTPVTVELESSILYVILEHEDYENNIGFILGNDDKAFVDIDGYFYKLERLK